MKPTTATFEAKASKPVSSAIRSVVGRDRPTESVGEHVTGTANGMQERLLEPVVELAPQAADVDVDDVGARIEMIVPDLLEKHGTGHHPPFVAGEIFEQEIFARFQFDLPTIALDAARQRIDLEIADQ